MSAEIKKSMRESLKEKRAELCKLHPEAADQAAHNFLNFFDFDPGTIIGVYWAMENELDTRPLLHGLSNMGCVCALPRVTDQGLVFHLWTPDLELESGNFGLSEPPMSSPVLEPQVLVVPLLGFDRGGHRIGYGKGHYDQYLHTHKGIFVGYGFAGQEVTEMPYEPHDIPMKYIVTETGVIIC
jgi:5-formyltetrahydrofolate cyclo-ligase